MITSSRSDSMSELWRARWGDARPVRHLLRVQLRDRWVRFHSLPLSKEYPESEVEWREVLRRHRTTVGELMHATATRLPLIVIGEDFTRRDEFHGWTKTALPGSWLWKTLEPDEDGADESFARVSRPFHAIGDLDPLLRKVADDEGEAGGCIVSDESLMWLYAPYPGGADVIAPTGGLRDELRLRHPDWLPADPPRPLSDSQRGIRDPSAAGAPAVPPRTDRAC